MDVCLQLKIICANIIERPESYGENLKKMLEMLPKVPQELLQRIQPNLLCVGVPMFKSVQEGKNSYKEAEKQLLVEVFNVIFQKTKVRKLSLFFNIYGFLVTEIYDHKQHKVKSISEEYKLSLLRCATSLVKSASWDLIPELYVKENAPKICQILFASLEIAKKERMLQLRLTALDCITTISRIEDESCSEMRPIIADVFMFFLPGIACGLKDIALEDEKSSHSIIAMALKTWAGLVALELEDSERVTKANKFDLRQKKESDKESKVNCKKGNDIKSYIESSQRDATWFRETDENLEKLFVGFLKLTQHSHEIVRCRLAELCVLIVDKCLGSAPKCVSCSVSILISLSQDENTKISAMSKIKLREMALKLSDDNFNTVVEYLEENLFNLIKSMPRIFNRKDCTEQLNALNSLYGYLELFGPKELKHILSTTVFLNQLLLTLIHISELEKTEVKLLEDYTSIELNTTETINFWIRFTYIDNERVISKLKKVIALLVKFSATEVVTDYLLDIYNNNFEHKCEATFILNNLFSDSSLDVSNCRHNLKTIILTYLEPNNWNLEIDTTKSDINLKSARSNLTQMCLQVEGMGQFAICLKMEFRQYLLQTLYPVLEKAGSQNPLLRLAGLKALNAIMKACNYPNVTELITSNSDYFSFYVIKKLKKLQTNEDVLNVLAVVLNYSTIEVLPSVSDIIKGILMQSCDEYHKKYATSYLRIFKIFLQSLHKWNDIKIEIKPIKSKKEKEKEFQEFKISNIKTQTNDFSDDIMGNKTPQEMYEEDLQSNQKPNLSDDDDDEYKKPTPPINIQIVVEILKRSLNFLPSKDNQRKILVLEILNLGIEVIKDWEDELLPIVHQIWSPLTGRFTETTEPLIVNLSFQLLAVLARVSQDFIRSRTTKDVLPQIKSLLLKFVKDSHLQDRGSSYRYTQQFKLQLKVLQEIGRVCVDLDLIEDEFNSVVDAVFPYLSCYQPIPLQEAALGTLKTFIQYDCDLMATKIAQLEEKFREKKEFEKNLVVVSKNLQEVKSKYVS